MCTLSASKLYKKAFMGVSILGYCNLLHRGTYLLTNKMQRVEEEKMRRVEEYMERKRD